MRDPEKHIFSHYPVEALPDELRAGLERETFVRVIIEREIPVAPTALVSLIGSGKGVYALPEDAVKTLRDMRDEWEG